MKTKTNFFAKDQRVVSDKYRSEYDRIFKKCNCKDCKCSKDKDQCK